MYIQLSLEYLTFVLISKFKLFIMAIEKLILIQSLISINL